MIVVDVETTGVNPNKNSIVSLGVIDFNVPENTFYGECRVWDGAEIDSVALSINGFSEEQIKDTSKQSEGELVSSFLKWLTSTNDHTIAGQNVFFDMGFLYAAAARANISISLARRIIDQHTLCYTHMIQRGLTPPLKNNRTDLDSDKIMEYVGIPAEPKPHVALNGAIWEAEAFSRLINNKSLFSQFEQYKIPWS